jgi:hypothetical protein
MTKSKKTIKAKINRVSLGGVYYRNDKKRYVARFTHNGNRVNVGSFLTERKAKTALSLARRTAMSV